MTVYDLAVMMMKRFDRLRSDMEFGFAKMNQRFNAMDDRLDHLERNHRARIEIVEDRTVVLKKEIEKGFSKKISW